ncbi:hypothetical protein [Desulfurivibrio sp. C05AmB]|uniref:hypothetical protein n=1 Tax=Desulfurivibrio sp. C05AmB TaxID=3374371 RepID=UPI00376EE561
MKIRAGRQIVYLWLLAALLGLWGSGCVAKAPPPPAAWRETPAELGTVGVAAAEIEPEIVFAGYARGRLAGAGRGAGIATLVFLDSTHSSDPLALLLLPPFVAVGAVSGAISAEPRKVVEAAEVEAKNALAALGLQQALQRRVVEIAAAEAGRDIVSLGGDSPGLPAETGTPAGAERPAADTVLEVAVLEAGSKESGGINAPVALYLLSRARLLKAEGDVLLFEKRYAYSSESRKFSAWCADDARLLRLAYGRGVEELAAGIVDDLFLSLPPPHDGISLVPILSPGRFGRSKKASLQPALAWEPFPRPEDQAWIGERSIENVSYELRVFRLDQKSGSYEWIVGLKGVPSPSHTLETPLAPKSKYRWQVRSRFELNGEIKVTRWSAPVDFKTPRQPYRPE